MSPSEKEILYKTFSSSEYFFPLAFIQKKVKVGRYISPQHTCQRMGKAP